MALQELPDELMLHILSFTTNNPIAIIKLSHTNKQMERILSSSSYSRVISRMIVYTPLDSKHSAMRDGYSLGKFWQNPWRNSFTVLKEFIRRILRPNPKAIVKTKPNPKTWKTLGESFSEMKEQVDSKQKLVECLKWSRRDPINVIYMIESWARNMERGNHRRKIYLGCTLLSLIVQLAFGKLSYTPSEERSFETGLWWIPYCFWPLEIILIAFNLVCISGVVFCIVSGLRILIFNPRKKWDPMLYAGIMALPIFEIALTIILRLQIIFIRTLVYKSIGLELSNFESIMSSIINNGYVQYFGLAVLGLFSFQNLSRLRTFDKLADPITASLISLSLFKYSESLLSFLPISLVACGISVKEIISKINPLEISPYLIPMGLGLSLGLFSVGVSSYLTFAPATSIFASLLISTFKQKKKEPERKSY